MKRQSVAWIGSRGPNRGRAQLRLDGSAVATIDTYAGTKRNREILYAASWATSGPHTFSITVRERQDEIAVLKVLGFRDWQILMLVLGEAGLIGALAGLVGAGVTYGLINHVFGGIQLTGFPLMLMPLKIFVWGPVLGIGTALVGGIVPAWSARRVRVSEVFASVA